MEMFFPRPQFITMIKYTIFKIKEGKHAAWNKWCVELMKKHYKEGIISIVEEDLMREKCIIVGDFVFYEHETFPGKKKKPWNPEREINHKHNKIHGECLERVGQIIVEKGKPVPGYDFMVDKIQFAKIKKSQLKMKKRK